MPIFEISSNNELMEKVTNAGAALCVVAFSSSVCGACKPTTDKIKEMSENMPEISFFLVNVRSDDEYVKCYGIRGVPSFIFCRDGNELERFQGGNADYLYKTTERLRKP